jgi:hypothetical protein
MKKQKYKKKGVNQRMKYFLLPGPAVLKEGENPRMKLQYYRPLPSIRL